jgi:mannose-6-phosphate isomerase-like protein (cupin superfamily)
MRYVRTVDFAAFPDAAFHSQRLADASTGLDSCICICTRVPPGRGTTSGLHTHPSDQLYYVLTGTMHARVADRTYVVEPGNLVVIPAGAPHWNWNEGTVDELHFELIVPPPGPGQSLVTPLDGSGPVGGLDIQVVRPLDDSRFDASRFSQVVLADRSTGVSTLSLGVFRVPPGSQGPGLHVHRFDQIYYMLSGSMELDIGFEHHTVGPNTLVVIPAGMPHRNWNASSEVEYHLNLRVPEPQADAGEWDLPVTFGTP